MFVIETKYNVTFMKKTWIIIIAVIAVIAIYGVSSYNSMVSQEEAVGTAWSNVENQYQRRADLIPNLVNTVKGYAAHEKETFDAVVSARAKATQTTVSIDDLTPEKMEAYQRAQGEVGSALSRLLAVTENYPELKANENFQTLQAQLEGTENRISVERRNFNDVARAYNTSIRRFPKNIFAGMFGFEKRPYFEAQEGAEKAPEVKF
jgi:LemA protein